MKSKQNVVEVNPSGNPYIDSELYGWKWGDTISLGTLHRDPLGGLNLGSALQISSPNLTYSFPQSDDEYLSMPSYDPGTSTLPWPLPPGYAYITNFAAFNPLQQLAADNILKNVSSFTNLTFTQTAEPDANLRFAEATVLDYTDDPSVAALKEIRGGHQVGITNAAAETNLPSLGDGGNPPAYAAYAQGDAWFCNASAAPGPDWNNPYLGSYEYASGLMHEIGHTLGLKHPFQDVSSHGDDFPVVLSRDSHDSFEYSVMTYFKNPNETQALPAGLAPDHPTTYMQDDIAALQYMYGARYDNEARVYTWDPNTG